MKIIVAGNGKAGTLLISQLVSEGHEVVAIDLQETVLSRLTDKCDVLTVPGNCLALKNLREAGAEHADLLIAVTGSDEVNMLCCLTAKKLNPKIHTIPRIRNPEYLDQIREMREELGVSIMINPDRDAAEEIFRILKLPGFIKRETFAKGRVQIVQLKVQKGDRLENSVIYKLPEILDCKVLLCAVVRNGKAFIPRGNDIILADDDIFITAPTKVLALLLRNLGVVTKKMRNVMLVGGGRVSFHLAQSLNDSGINVKIIESDPDRARYLSEVLEGVSVVCRDGSSQEVLDSEGLTDMDALVTLTGLDEINIVISMYGASKNVPTIITKINRITMPSMLNEIGIGTVISSTQISGNIVTQYVRALQNQSGAALTVHKIADSLAEALEFRTDTDTKYLKTPLREIPFAKNILLSCITTAKGVTIIPDGNSMYSEGDSIVVVSTSDEPILHLNDIFKS